MSDLVGKYLSHNVKSLRQSQNLSQRQLAEKAELPRTTLSNMESAEGNPSLSNLVKVAGALRVTVDELLAPPYNPIQLIKKSQVPQNSQGGGRVTIFKIVPRPIKGFEIDRVIIQGESRMKGVPHMTGTKEFLHCLSGRISLFTEGDRFDLEEGDVSIFPGDRPHSYLNPGKKTAEYISIIHHAQFQEIDL